MLSDIIVHRTSFVLGEDIQILFSYFSFLLHCKNEMNIPFLEILF